MALLTSTFHQLIVFAHLFLFAFAVVEVLKKDIRLLLEKSFSIRDIQMTAGRLTGLLGALWVTGIALVYIKIGWDFQALTENPKLMAKFTVVAILTINGLALHFIAFPLMERPRDYSGMVCSVLGAISAVSWLFASFIGAARILAAELNYLDFLTVYLVVLCGAIGVAVLIVKDQLQEMLLPNQSRGAFMPAGLGVAPRQWSLGRPLSGRVVSSRAIRPRGGRRAAVATLARQSW